MAVTKRTRFEVLRRDGHTCRYCGASAPDVALQVDHVIPVALGGTDGPDNLVAACRDCNYGKSSSSPNPELVAQVNADAFRWAAAMKRAVEIHQERAEAREEYEWQIYKYFYEGCWSRWVHRDTEEQIPLPDDWDRTFIRFIEYGIEPAQLEAWVSETAMNPNVLFENKFRYVCGIAWKRVRELQDIAKQIIDNEDAGAAA